MVTVSSPAAPASRVTPFAALAVLTGLNSLGTGVFWSGTYFVTETDFGFGKVANLWLAIAMSAVYALVALRSSHFVRILRRRLSTRAIVAAVLMLATGSSLLALLEHMSGVVACALITSMAGALLWPIVEIYLTAGRHGPAMRSVIGSFNLVWMTSTVLALVAMGPLLKPGLSRMALVAYAPIALLSALALLRFPPEPAAHEPDAAQGHVPQSYGPLLAASRVLLPISYLFIGALSPLIPYVVERVGITAEAKTPMTATWMVARVVIVVLLMRLTVWHGRRATLGVAVACLFGGFALVVLAQSVAAVVAGLTLIGAGQGTLYYATLYYSMAVGRSAVEASSLFEALVGLGYLLGPIAALGGQAFGGGAATVVCVSAVAGIALVPAVRAAWSMGRG